VISKFKHFVIKYLIDSNVLNKYSDESIGIFVRVLAEVDRNIPFFFLDCNANHVANLPVNVYF